MMLMLMLVLMLMVVVMRMVMIRMLPTEVSLLRGSKDHLNTQTK